MVQINLSGKSRFYIIFLFLVLFFIKFSTTSASSKTFNIVDLEITKPYDAKFEKEKIIDEAFMLAFKELILKITISEDSKNLKTKDLKVIESLVDSFTIVDEKFIKKNYIAKFEVNFDKKEVLQFLENKNIFPSIPLEKKLLLMPILVDINKNEILLFSENPFYKDWNKQNKKYNLIKYILPNEDLEDIKLINKNLYNIEEFNFKEIIDKYELNDFIIIIIFKNDQNLRILSKLNLNNYPIISNKTFKDVNIENIDKLSEVISSLKINYENHWKKINQINTSIKLSLNIFIDSKNYKLINKFESDIKELDLVSNYYIKNFSNEKVEYKIIYNGTPDKFIEEISNKGFNMDTSSEVWKIE